MTDKNPLAHYSGVLSEAVQESAAVPDQAQIKALMRKHRIWIEHSTLLEDDEPPRELRAVQAEQHQFEAFVQDLIALATAPAAQVTDFQKRVQPWMMTCFGPEISADRVERNHRFLEESLELVQSLGCTASEAHQLVDYVFGRPVGDPMQETGGVMVTLAALCLASGLDMHACGETELARIWTKVEAIRAKQAAKPKHSPLPMHAPQAQADARDADGEAFRTAARLGLTLRFYGNCAQSGTPGTSSAYEVIHGQDSAAAMREAIQQADAAIAQAAQQGGDKQ